MKRQSKAEEALYHQAQVVRQEIKTLYDEINHRQSQISALSKIAENIEFSIETMKLDRQKASVNATR